MQCEVNGSKVQTAKKLRLGWGSNLWLSVTTQALIRRPKLT